MFSRLNVIAPAVGMALLSGCGGGEGGAIDLEFVGAASAASAIVIGEGDAAVDVTHLEIQLREIKILPDETESPEADKFKAKGTFTVDLLDGENSTLSVDLEPGLYKKVEFKVDKPDDGEGINGTDASLWFEGTKAGTKFRYVDDRMDKITMRHVEGVDLDDGGAEALLVNLDIPSWLAGVDLGALEADAEGVVVIDGSGPNKKAHDAVEDNIKTVIKLVRKP